MSKTYVGGCKAIQTQYGELLKLSFSAKDLEVLQANLNGAGYVNLNINQRKEPSQYGQTHSVSIDDWTPDKAKGMNQAKQAAQPQQAMQQQPSGFDDFEDQDIPF